MPPPPPLCCQVLRAAGYYSHALWVAQQSSMTDWTLDILLDDMGSAHQALTFLDTLPRRWGYVCVWEGGGHTRHSHS